MNIIHCNTRTTVHIKPKTNGNTLVLAIILFFKFSFDELLFIRQFDE